MESLSPCELSEGNSEGYMKEGSGNGVSVSVQGLYKGNLEGGSFSGDSKR